MKDSLLLTGLDFPIYTIGSIIKINFPLREVLRRTDREDLCTKHKLAEGSEMHKNKNSLLNFKLWPESIYRLINATECTKKQKIIVIECARTKNYL